MQKTELIEARKRAGLTQEQAAEKLGTNHRTLSCWERGVSEIRMTTYVDLMKIYGVQVQLIYWRRGKPDDFDATYWVKCDATERLVLCTLNPVEDAFESQTWDLYQFGKCKWMPVEEPA